MKVETISRRYNHVALCVMLSKLWHVVFKIAPCEDFVTSGQWYAEFSASVEICYGNNLPLAFACYGNTVDEASMKLLASYINQYGDNMALPYATVRSEAELVAKYEFMYG